MTAELTIFIFGGKSYIGYLCTPGSGENLSFTGLGSNVNDYYVVRAPAEISYTLDISTDSTADVTSHIMPMIPGGFITGAKENVYFAFPKSHTACSTLKKASINTNIINQYNQMTGLQ